MIASLRGTILARAAGTVVIEVGGLGYRVSVSSNTLSSLPAIGAEAFLLTHMTVRDDGIFLYGFATDEERALFIKLIGVSGIGPKVALSALSSYNPQTLASLIAAGDITRASSIPGIGKKTAQRLVLELKGSIGELFANETPSFIGGRNQDALDALMSMGFSADESSYALEGYDGPSTDSGTAVRYALKKLGSRQ